MPAGAAANAALLEESNSAALSTAPVLGAIIFPMFSAVKR
jgi:hypothetical protein